MKRSSSEVASPHDVAELQKRKKKRPKPSGEADNAASPAASVGHGAATEGNSAIVLWMHICIYLYRICRD